MNKLTNGEITKVFALHLGQSVIMTKGNKELLRTNCWSQGSIVTIKTNTIFNLTMSNNCFKIILKNLSNISNEDALEVYKLLDLWGVKSIGMKVETVKNILKKGYSSGSNMKVIFWHYLYQYLISKGYAVPLYFGLTHWANEMTAIELGVAIEP